MATVHLGRLRGERGFARTVAIKRLHSQYARDPDFVSMLVDEARIAARVKHPNVVPPLDVIAIDEEELLLVMEYVHGEVLARLLGLCVKREERVPPEIVVAVIGGAPTAWRGCWTSAWPRPACGPASPATGPPRERSRTCPPSSCAEGPSIAAPTCSRWAWCCGRR
jgi:hypothetical protein